MHFLGKPLLSLFCYRKIPNSSIPQILATERDGNVVAIQWIWHIQKQPIKQQKGVVIQLGIIILMEDQGWFEQRVLKLNLFEGKVK